MARQRFVERSRRTIKYEEVYCVPMMASKKHGNRSAATSPSTTQGDLTQPLTAAPRIKPTLTRCRSARQRNPRPTIHFSTRGKRRDVEGDEHPRLRSILCGRAHGRGDCSRGGSCFGSSAGFFRIRSSRVLGVMLIISGIPGLFDSLHVFHSRDWARRRRLRLAKPRGDKSLSLRANPIYIALVSVTVGQALLFGDGRLLLVRRSSMVSRSPFFVVLSEEQTLQLKFGMRCRNLSRQHHHAGYRG